MFVTPLFAVKEEIVKNKPFPQSCIELLREYRERQKLEKQRSKEESELFVGKILPLELAGKHAGKDAYNPSAPFQLGSKKYLCGRVEPPETCDSQVLLFEESTDGVWRPAENSPLLPLEDGFAVRIDQNETIIGGTKAYPNPTADNPDRIDYHTVFYCGCGPEALKEFARGPDRMKDIRLILRANGHIFAFTRPTGIQPDGRDCGRGKIAVIELNDRSEINPENLSRAKIIENQFAPGDWGGVNELYALPDGRIGVLGHIAYMDEEGNRHYYAMVFIYDPETHQATPIEIIASRDDFPPGDAKAPDLRDVAYPGGMVRHGDGTATLYLGLSDKNSGHKKIKDPFWMIQLTQNDTAQMAETPA
jgi:hypothetical protein